MKGFINTHKRRLIILFVLGLCAVSTQVVLLREFLMIFGGNELLIGIFLANWLIITALGAFSGRRLVLPDSQIPYWTIFYSWLTIPLLYLMDGLRDILFLPGVQATLFQVSLFSAVLLLPVCFLSGLLFACMSRDLSGSGISGSAEWTYGMESMGSFTGGLLITFTLMYLFDNYIAACLFALPATLLILLTTPGTGILRTGLFLLVLLVSVQIFFAGSRFSRQYLFRNQEILDIKDTPYGNITITNLSGQINFYSNRLLLFSTDNQLAREEAVHFAMVQHPSPHRVLLISGGIGGLTEEILKYTSVEEIDYLEPDPELLVLGKKYTSTLEDKRIRAISGDPRIFVRTTRNIYDVVLVCLPEPATYQLNRYYSVEFLNDVKRKLSASGILSFSLPRSANYLSKGELIMHSSLYLTARRLFHEVVIFPGDKSYFVVSDSLVKTNIGQLIEDKYIITNYINSYYIDDVLMQQRMASLLSRLSVVERINTDFRPVAVSGYFHYWLSLIGVHRLSLPLLIVLLTIFLIVFTQFSPPSLSGMFAAGFAGSALQVVFLISFQAVYGTVYRSLGIFSAVFMAGLGLGAWLRPLIFRAPAINGLVIVLTAFAGISFTVPAMIALAENLVSKPLLLHLLFLVMILIVSTVSGLIFSLSAAIGNRHTNRVASVYGADLAGAALGAVAVTCIIIPLAGIKASSWVPGLIILLTGLSLLIRKQK